MPYGVEYGRLALAAASIGYRVTGLAIRKCYQETRSWRLIPYLGGDWLSAHLQAGRAFMIGKRPALTVQEAF